jgi:hypothetical protein
MHSITTVVFLTLTTVLASQELKPDTVRDEALRQRLQDFVAGTATIKEIEVSLRQFASDFETAPYKMRWSPPERPYVDVAALSEEKTKSIFILIARLTLPIQRSYFSGQLGAMEAARKLAPFYFLFPGYGLDPPPDADQVWYQRRDDLQKELSKLHQ